MSTLGLPGLRYYVAKRSVWELTWIGGARGAHLESARATLIADLQALRSFEQHVVAVVARGD